ncbi:MAG: nucleoside monophosphate kinase [Candidatus Diapherotrites archaeon]|uniref:Cytidylate kinase n=1 Tax=Candidatus Iainarchaeum sp. TaxID=3101447 RepID=A0A939C8I9_9ARCH|nr:nucleoside monophosphate kinase [Candidatus Diapherotrites archaeon]
MIVTITGLSGSGKSTLAKGIAKDLGLEHYSAGDFLREIAKEQGKTLMQLHEEMERNRKIDDLLDERTKRLGRERNSFVIDGRVAWHFIPNSIKVFVTVDLEKAAERVFRDRRPGEKENSSLQETKRNMRKRNEMNKARYKKLYGIDYLDKRNYDIVVDTTKRNEEQTREKAVREIKRVEMERAGKGGKLPKQDKKTKPQNRFLNGGKEKSRQKQRALL